MQCFKRNHRKGKLDACSQRRLIPIGMSVLLLAAFIILSMATTVSAQSQTFLQERATLQEENLAVCLSNYVGKNDLQKKGCESMLARYMRDGCIGSLTGDWRWDPSGDIVRIAYDEKYGTFGGSVIKPVKLGYTPGHLLFIVNFPHDSMKKLAEEAWTDRLNSTYAFTVDQYVTFLRGKKNCKNWWFEGTEYSFNQTTKTKTEMKLKLVLSVDRLSYIIGTKVWHLTRIR